MSLTSYRTAPPRGTYLAYTPRLQLQPYHHCMELVSRTCKDAQIAISNEKVEWPDDDANGKDAKRASPDGSALSTVNRSYLATRRLQCLAAPYSSSA